MTQAREVEVDENRPSVPTTNSNPPVRFLRASHASFTSRDLVRSREFYTEVLGLVVSDEDRDTLYLRGLEERAHHSLTLRRKLEEPTCLRVGMRVAHEDDLERAKYTFERHGLPCRWVDEPFQGRTLHTVDVVGTPLEIVASMPPEPRKDSRVQTHKGAASRRFDHYQVTVPDVYKAAEFYSSLGFRIADYITVGHDLIGVFLHVKNSPYDLVFIKRHGPAIHHFAYIIEDVQAMFRACDIMGELGWGENVEFGPGKHSLGHSYYVYVRDPDGHRIELLLPPIIYTDGDDPPVVIDAGKLRSPVQAWGLPPRATWVNDATPFLDCEITALPGGDQAQPTLESYLGLTALAAAKDIGG